MQENMVSKAINEIGSCVLARAVRCSPTAVYKWRNQGRLPRTEWTGETNYAAEIERLSDGKFTREMLLRRAVVLNVSAPSRRGG